jgi:hypothetical protein
MFFRQTWPNPYPWSYRYYIQIGDSK